MTSTTSRLWALPHLLRRSVAQLIAGSGGSALPADLGMAPLEAPVTAR